MKHIIETYEFQDMVKAYLEDQGLELDGKVIQVISNSTEEGLVVRTLTPEQAEELTKPKTEPPVKKRTRRTKEQIEADNKAAAEKTSKEANPEESPITQQPDPVKETPTFPKPGEPIKQEKAEKEEPKSLFAQATQGRNDPEKIKENKDNPFPSSTPNNMFAGK